MTTSQSETLANDVMVKTRDKLNVIDDVFSEVGFDKCFLDNPQAPGKPHIRAKDVNTPLILHVDDDVNLVDVVTSRLKACGYRVACALDGVSGVQSALLYPASAVILDYDMPNGRGDVVIELLKGHERTRNIPILVLTAIQKKSLKRELLAKGADVFMRKPFDFQELQETLAALIEQRGNDTETDCN